MQKHLKRKCLSALPKFLLALAGTLLILPVWAGQAGTVTHLAGTLSAKKADGSVKILSLNSEVAEGDELSTQQETYARIKFIDGGEIVMRPNSQLKITAYSYADNKPQSDNIVLDLVRGGLRAVTGLLGKRNRDQFQLRTGTATIGIRGTHFGALFCNGDCGGIPTASGQPPSDGLHVDVSSGTIIVRNAGGSGQFNAGQFGFIANNNTPPVVVPPQNGIPVTMPSNISQNKGGGQGIGKGKTAECEL